MTSGADRIAGITRQRKAGWFRKAYCPEWLPGEERLHARFRYLAAGDRRANSDPATLAGESTRFLRLWPTRTVSDRPRPQNWPVPIPLQTIATFRMLHSCWLGVGSAWKRY